MTFFSLRSRDHKRSQKEIPLPEFASKLYVIGSKPNEGQDAEWMLEVESQVSKQNSANIEKDQGREPGERQGSTSHGLTKDHHTCLSEAAFFSLRSGSIGTRSTTLSVDKPIIKISIPISPYYSASSAASDTSPPLINHIEQALKQLTCTGTSEECLKAGLTKLQRQPPSHNPILPASDQGFDVDKFVYFASSALQYRYSRFQSAAPTAEAQDRSPITIPEQYVSQEQIEACGGAEDTVQKIDYAKFLMENAELRRKMEQGTQSKFLNLDNYPELQARYDASHGKHTSEQADHHDGRNKKKGFGGFWISYGNNRDQVDQDEEVRTQRDPYGGLM